MRISKSYCAGSNFSTRDVKAAAALCAGESFNPSRKVDPEMIESVYASLRSTRQRHSVHEMIGEGEWVAVQTAYQGVHEKDSGTLA